MVREIVTPKKENYNIHIPKEYLNHKVEILVLPFDENKEVLNVSSGNTLLQETFGIIDNTDLDPVEWQRKIRSEWDDRI